MQPKDGRGRHFPRGGGPGPFFACGRCRCVFSVGVSGILIDGYNRGMAQPIDVAAPADPSTAPRGGPPPRTVLLIGGVVLLAIVILAVVAAVVFKATHRGVRYDGRGRPVDHVVSGPLDGRREATFDLRSGAISVTVRGLDLGDRLYRIETPDNANIVPAVSDSGGNVGLQLNNVDGTGPSAVVVQLNRAVRWQLRFTAGATTDAVDLKDMNISGVIFIGGVTNIDLTLPRPHGTLPVQMGGGASRFGVHAPAGVPVRVRAGGGAGGVSVDDTTRSGVAAGTVITPDGWDSATDRYDIDNTAGVSAVTVDRF